MNNCYDFDGKLKKLFGQDKLFLDDLESAWLGSFDEAIKKFLIEKNIINTLNKNMSISSLKIVNESFMHNAPINSETHFKIVIVSNDFDNLSLLDRHKLVYKNLGTLVNKIHAISIHSFNFSIW